MNWNDFEIKKVINEDNKFKHLALHLQNKNDSSDAVILLDRPHFNSSDPVALHRLISELVPVDSNDIYHRFVNHKEAVECKAIYPATEAHLKKYSEQGRRIIQETPEMHRSITRPHYEILRDSGQIGWIDNILADQSEMERRIVDEKCPETGYILLPDYKWIDESNLAGFYLLILVRRRDLWSVRDLTKEHLPLLKNIRKSISNSVSSKYKYPNGEEISYDHLRVYFHYPPTYPHLHIHVTLAASQNSCAAGQAILLDEVIDNLETVASDYYKNIRTLSMEFGDQHELYNKLKPFQNKEINLLKIPKQNK